MKKYLITVCCMLLFSIYASSEGKDNHYTKKPAAFLNYVWYKDEDMTDPTGTISAITIELNRLQALFPTYIFTTNSTIGLSEYEYGYSVYLPTVVIYSNR